MYNEEIESINFFIEGFMSVGHILDPRNRLIIGKFQDRTLSIHSLIEYKLHHRCDENSKLSHQRLIFHF